MRAAPASSLLSSGHAEGTAAFLDASESGDDVFFYTPAQLSVTDKDSETDIYDARVGGEPATLSPLAECQGEACQPPAAAPALQTPAGATFRGPGNVREKARAPAAARSPPARQSASPAAPARRAGRQSAWPAGTGSSPPPAG